MTICGGYLWGTDDAQTYADRQYTLTQDTSPDQRLRRTGANTIRTPCKSLQRVTPMERIPFVLPDVGLREISGHLYVENDFLVIELLDALMGEFDKEKKVIEIEPAALEVLQLDTGIFKDKLVVRTYSSEFLKHIPGDHEGEVVFRCWRKYRDGLRRLSLRMLHLMELE